MKPRLVVALDPGGATGWAELAEDGTVSLSVVGDKHTVCQRMDDLLAATPGVQVVMETFVPRPNVTFVPDSLHIIGTVSYLCWKWGHNAPIMQSPAEAKRGFPDKRLKSWHRAEWYSGSDHARDAARHLAVYLMRQRRLDPRTGEVSDPPDPQVR